MYRLITTLFALVTCSFLFGQQEEIELNNPSFEDVPHQGIDITRDMGIRGWYSCGTLQFPGESAPDIHPVPPRSFKDSSYWRVTKTAYEGDTYLGLVVRDNDTWESVSQRLPTTLRAGVCYEVSMYLMRSPVYVSGSKEKRTKKGSFEMVNYTQPTVLRIYGGTGVCGRQEIIASSKPIANGEWEQYTFKLEPTRNTNYITLEAFWQTPVRLPYNGHVLVDNLSTIVEIPCDDIVAEVAPQNEAPPKPKPKKTSPKPKEKVKKAPVQQSGIVTTTNRPAPRKVSGLGYEKIKEGQIIRIENLYFQMDKSMVLEKSFTELDKIHQFLMKNNGVVVEIGGHTNTVPPKEYCLRLSKERAKSVADYLIDKGISEHRIKYKGYGKSKPILENDKFDMEARQKNQRVEIKILELG